MESDRLLPFSSPFVSHEQGFFAQQGLNAVMAGIGFILAMVVIFRLNKWNCRKDRNDQIAKENHLAQLLKYVVRKTT